MANGEACGTVSSGAPAMAAAMTAASSMCSDGCRERGSATARLEDRLASPGVDEGVVDDVAGEVGEVEDEGGRPSDE